MNECFGILASEFQSSEAFHSVVPFFIQRFHVLTYVTKTGFTFLVGYLGYIDIIGRLKELSLRSAHDLKIIEFKVS